MLGRAALTTLITVTTLAPALPAQSDGLEELAKLTDVDSPALDSQAAGETSGFAVEAGEEKQVARLRLVRKLGDNPLALTVSSPIAKTETRADFLDLDGLSDSLTAELAYTAVFWPNEWNERTPASVKGTRSKRPSSRTLYREAMLECHKITTSQDGAADLPSREQFAAYLETPLPNHSNEFLAANRAALQLEKRCADGLEGILQGNPPSIYSWRRRVIPRGAVPMLGLAAKVGNKSFEYVLTEDLAPAKEKKNGYSAGLAFGFLFPRTTNRDSVLWFNVKSERTYAAAKAQVRICQPLAVTGSESCQPAKAFGPPTSMASELYSLEYRHFIGATAGGPRFAVSPIAFYRDLNIGSQWGLDIPFYFLTDNEGGLTAGLRASYRQNTNDVTVSFFVGKALRILN